MKKLSTLTLGVLGAVGYAYAHVARLARVLVTRVAMTPYTDLNNENDSPLARFILAFLLSVGAMYIFLAPLIISGLTALGSVDASEAGIIVSANLLGTTLGCGFAYFLVTRVRWKLLAGLLMFLLVTCDLGSMWAQYHGFTMLLIVRMTHGLMSGLLVATVAATIARAGKADQSFAFLLFIQLAISGTIVAVFTTTVQTEGPMIVWLSLVFFSFGALVLLPFAGDYPVQEIQHGNSTNTAHAPWVMVCPAMLALFLYNASQLGIFSYILELGREKNYEAEWLGWVLATSYWIGVPAALWVAWYSDRGKRIVPMSIGMIVAVVATASLLLDSFPVFAIATVVLGGAVSIVIPYLLGVIADFDNIGRIAALGTVVNNLGLAVGPFAGAVILAAWKIDYFILVSAGFIAISFPCAIYAARRLDHSKKRGGDW
jgi:predicted MFS family arabinose efflux permease